MVSDYKTLLARHWLCQIRASFYVPLQAIIAFQYNCSDSKDKGNGCRARHPAGAFGITRSGDIGRDWGLETKDWLAQSLCG